MKIMTQLMIGFALIALAIGCSKKVAEVDTPVNYDGSKFVLSVEPSGGRGVLAIRETAKDQDDVVIVGRIGGSLTPWVDGRAAFQIVDPSLVACSDETEDGEVCSCKTPWDYCCESDPAKAMTLVQFVEADGAVVRHDARKIFELEELQTVIVKGKAKRDDAGNLTIMAEGMFVRK